MEMKASKFVFPLAALSLALSVAACTVVEDPDPDTTVVKPDNPDIVVVPPKTDNRP
jgi:hypothetical protein